jgi:translation initiation factor 2 beta subunit (eIF-2beta)/eIF-5
MFDELLDNAYDNLKKIQIDNKKIILPKMNINLTPIRLHWSNVFEYTELLNTNIDIFYKFLKAELCSYNMSWYNNEKKEGIIIHGKYLKNLQLMNIVKKYILLYCTCKSCKSIYTKLEYCNKYNKLICKSCFSESTITL